MAVTSTVSAATSNLIKGGNFRLQFLLPTTTTTTSSSAPTATCLGIGIWRPRDTAPLTSAICCLPLFRSSGGSRHHLSYLNFLPFCTAANVDAEAAIDSSKDGDIRDAANMLDLRVGRILKAWRHEEADSLYVEEVDVGESDPRIICSGLVKYLPLHHLQDKKVVVLANLKPRNMRGVKSSGMLMAASDLAHENVELLEPPEGSLPGERIWFGSEDDKDNQPDPATPNQIQKKKIWELVQPHLKTDASCSAMLGEHYMRTSAGVVVCRSLKNANIS